MPLNKSSSRQHVAAASVESKGNFHLTLAVFLLKTKANAVHNVVVGNMQISATDVMKLVSTIRSSHRESETF